MLKKTIPILSAIAAVVMLLIAAKALTNLQDQQDTQTTAIDIDSVKQQVIAFISQNKQLEAQAAIDKLYLDFADNPKMAAAVYDIAEAYRNSSKFESSLAFYKDVIAKWPASEQAMWAQRGIAISYVALGKLTEAQAELEKLKAGFSTEPNIAEAVFNVADAYYWFGKFKEADGVYKYVTENFPKSDFGMWAQMGLAISSISQEKDSDAEAAKEKMLSVFNGNPKLPEALLYIAGRYEWSRKYGNAKSTYQQIIQDFSESSQASEAKYAIDRINCFSLFDSNSLDKAAVALNNFIEKYKDNPSLHSDVSRNAERYYGEGDKKSKEGAKEQAEILYRKAILIWERELPGLPSSTLAPEIYCLLGDCLHKMKEYEKSKSYFQKVLNEYPDYKYVWHALFMTGYNLERMVEAGTVRDSEATQKIKETYQQLLEKYPTCPPSANAKYWLYKHNSL